MTSRGRDLLAWVGYSAYPTISDYIREASRVGVRRRIGNSPGGGPVGRLWLVHDEGVRGQGVIFAYCNVAEAFEGDGLYLTGRQLVVLDQYKDWCGRPRFRSYMRVSRHRIESLPPIQMTTPTNERLWARWSVEERQDLLDMVDRLGAVQACKLHAKRSGRTYASCMWQYRKIVTRL